MAAVSECDMLRALEPVDINWEIGEEGEQDVASVQRTPGPQSLAAWVIIQASRDAMTPDCKTGKGEVRDAVRFWQDREYENYARIAGISMSVLECMRTLVLSRHGAKGVNAGA